MRISIPLVETELGTPCTEANVSIAISSSVAIRVVPVDADGVEHPEATQTIVGGPSSPDVRVIMNTVALAVEAVLEDRAV
jgi:hypothetical protein